MTHIKDGASDRSSDRDGPSCCRAAAAIAQPPPSRYGVKGQLIDTAEVLIQNIGASVWKSSDSRFLFLSFTLGRVQLQLLFHKRLNASELIALATLAKSSRYYGQLASPLPYHRYRQEFESRYTHPSLISKY